ncbi:MAG: type IV pilus modification protein PilV [Zoogloeaceae bacterium]|jgi:type IV pilus assembly protein PilV|nr:type IV pilus modification protein PilV [Zoogloeaceae bacterium]
MRETSIQKPGGFSLLEVLIAIVVLSIGLLGLVGLQTSALKLNSSATSRSVALDYANAMLDKVRTNQRGAEAGFYSVNHENGANVQVATSGDSAWKDTNNWLRNLEKSVPAAKVQSCRTTDGKKCSVGKGNYYMVCIKWDQGRAEDADGKSKKGNLFEKGSQQVFLLGEL